MGNKEFLAGGFTAGVLKVDTFGVAEIAIPILTGNLLAGGLGKGKNDQDFYIF